MKPDLFQVYTYSISGVFAQGAKHPLFDYLSFFIIIICWTFCAYTQILSREVEDFCVHAQKFLIMILDNKVLEPTLDYLRIYANP